MNIHKTRNDVDKYQTVVTIFLTFLAGCVIGWIYEMCFRNPQRDPYTICYDTCDFVYDRYCIWIFHKAIFNMRQIVIYFKIRYTKEKTWYSGFSMGGRHKWQEQSRLGYRIFQN